MTRANPIARPEQGAGNPTPNTDPAPCDPMPEDLPDRIIEAIRAEDT